MNDGPLGSARMSREAWEATLALCRADLAARGKVDPPEEVQADPQADLTDGVRRELTGMGVLSKSGAVDRSWADALGAHSTAPVRGELTSRFGDVTGSTRITVVGDRALVVHQKSATRKGPDGAVQRGLSREVDVAFARTQGLWPLLAATLPPLEQLRAPDDGAHSAGTAPETLTSADASAFTGAAPSSALPALARTLVEDEKATLAMVVEAWPTPERPVARWSKLWAVAGDELISVSLGAGTAELTPCPPGDIAAELEWALVSATTRATTQADGGRA